jgi:NgoPII restriction endonuclease.
MSNVIKAFLKIVTNYQANIQNITNGNNRANNMGEGLEHYIKEMFADVSANDSQERRLEIFQETYSYQGNKNNPPDLILKNSDAIEIKNSNRMPRR